MAFSSRRASSTRATAGEGGGGGGVWLVRGDGKVLEVSFEDQSKSSCEGSEQESMLFGSERFLFFAPQIEKSLVIDGTIGNIVVSPKKVAFPEEVDEKEDVKAIVKTVKGKAKLESGLLIQLMVF